MTEPPEFAAWISATLQVRAAAERVVTLAREVMQHLPCAHASTMRDAIEEYENALRERMVAAGSVRNADSGQ